MSDTTTLAGLPTATLDDFVERQEKVLETMSENGVVPLNDSYGRRRAFLVDPAVFDLLHDIAEIAKDPKRYNAFFGPSRPKEEDQTTTYEKVFG